MIVTVTGESEWRDRETVWRVLDEELARFLDHDDDLGEFVFNEYEAAARAGFILRHGACPSGADAMANEWGIARGVTIERFPAKWRDTHGYNPAAGPIRNREMAAALPRADKCVAFWSGRMRKVGQRDVSGTLDMMKQALQHGIPLRADPPQPKDPP